jgi:hypothetical protein
MGATVGSLTLYVTAFGASVPTAGGPALLGEGASAVLLAVTDSDGAPVTKLAAQDFVVAAIILSGVEARKRAFAVEGFSEPHTGVYALALPNSVRQSNGAVACVVDVRDSRSGVATGRAIVAIPQ